MRWAGCAVVLVACTGRAPTCEQAAEAIYAKGMLHLPDGHARDTAVGAVLIAACERDGWGPDARRCYGAVSSGDDLAGCTAKLTEAQQLALSAAVGSTTSDLEAAVRRPRPASALAPLVSTPLVVAVHSDSTRDFEGRRVDDAELRQALTAAAHVDAQTQVLIRADPTTPHGAVVHVMEVARESGLQRLSIGTAPATP